MRCMTRPPASRCIVLSRELVIMTTVHVASCLLLSLTLEATEDMAQPDTVSNLNTCYPKSAARSPWKFVPTWPSLILAASCTFT